MSMSEALRGRKAEWMRPADSEQVLAPESQTVLQGMQGLVGMAGVKAKIDCHCETWAAVCAWAATELLETFAKQEGADDEHAAALRARQRTLRDMLVMDQRREVVKFEDISPHIP